MQIRVHEIGVRVVGDRYRTVFLRDFDQSFISPSFIFLRYWEVVGAPLAFLVSRPPDFTAKSRDSEIASTLTTKRTPSFAARWLNSSQKLLLCSKKQQNFQDLKNIASSLRYGDFSEGGPKIVQGCASGRQPKTEKMQVSQYRNFLRFRLCIEKAGQLLEFDSLGGMPN